MLPDVEHIGGLVAVAEPRPPHIPSNVISIFFFDEGDGFCTGVWYSAP